MTAADRKPLFWIGSSQKDMQQMPEDVKDVFGSALLDAQYGDTYRAAYTAAFGDAVYVLDVFQKKAKSGRSTPKYVKDRVRARFRAAEVDHQRRFGG
jgi:phage-related protein